eukprot:2827794-Pleurochrysis_carterae.AAC.1
MKCWPFARDISRLGILEDIYRHFSALRRFHSTELRAARHALRRTSRWRKALRLGAPTSKTTRMRPSGVFLARTHQRAWRGRIANRAVFFCTVAHALAGATLEDGRAPLARWVQTRLVDAKTSRTEPARAIALPLVCCVDTSVRGSTKRLCRRYFDPVLLDT